jgi:hypothetical protein
MNTCPCVNNVDLRCKPALGVQLGSIHEHAMRMHMHMDLLSYNLSLPAILLYTCWS